MNNIESLNCKSLNLIVPGSILRTTRSYVYKDLTISTKHLIYVISAAKTLNTTSGDYRKCFVMINQQTGYIWIDQAELVSGGIIPA